MQKFIKNTTKKKLVIPNVVMELSEFERGEMVEICALPDAVVVLKREMTAMELIRAVESLQRLAMELNRHLARVCGPCEDCNGSGGEDCPADPSRTATVIPDEVRKEVHIPADAKLCAWPGDKPGTVTVEQADYRYDLTDVPEWELSALAMMGVCLGNLEERLMAEDVVYGA